MLRGEDAVLVGDEVELVSKTSFPYWASLMFPQTGVEDWR